MATLGANIPQVIQQAGDVSRLQDITQRAGDLQQSAAAAEVQREQQREGSQVRPNQAADAQNRVRNRQREDRQPSDDGPRGRRRAQAKPDKPTEKPPTPEGGAVVNVVV